MDLTHLQSVLEAFEEEAFFMSSRSLERDYVNAFVGEVNPVIPETCSSLTLIPREALLRGAYTVGKAVKR
jgi:hypothetical protein